jgi:hypothetical protein
VQTATLYYEHNIKFTSASDSRQAGNLAVRFMIGVRVANPPDTEFSLFITTTADWQPQKTK